MSDDNDNNDNKKLPQIWIRAGLLPMGKEQEAYNVKVEDDDTDGEFVIEPEDAILGSELERLKAGDHNLRAIANIIRIYQRGYPTGPKTEATRIVNNLVNRMLLPESRNEDAILAVERSLGKLGEVLQVIARAVGEK